MPARRQRWLKGVLERRESHQGPISICQGVGPGDAPREKMRRGLATFTAAQMVPGTHQHCGELVFPERCFKRETCPVNHICWSYQGIFRNLTCKLQESTETRDWGLGMWVLERRSPPFSDGSGDSLNSLQVMSSCACRSCLPLKYVF